MAAIIGETTVSIGGVVLGVLAPEPIAIRLPQELLDDAAACAPIRDALRRRWGQALAAWVDAEMTFAPHDKYGKRPRRQGA